MSQDASGLHLFALVCERLGQLDLALELLTQAIGILERAYEETEDQETERRYAIGHVNLGRVRLAISDHPGAIAAFEVVLGLTEGQEDQSADHALALIRTQARFGSGLASFKLGQLEDALASFESALEEVPREMPDVRGHVVILLAQTLWAIGGEEAQETAKDQLLAW